MIYYLPASIVGKATTNNTMMGNPVCKLIILWMAHINTLYTTHSYPLTKWDCYQSAANNPYSLTLVIGLKTKNKHRFILIAQHTCVRASERACSYISSITASTAEDKERHLLRHQPTYRLCCLLTANSQYYSTVHSVRVLLLQTSHGSVTLCFSVEEKRGTNREHAE